MSIQPTATARELRIAIDRYRNGESYGAHNLAALVSGIGDDLIEAIAKPGETA